MKTYCRVGRNTGYPDTNVERYTQTEVPAKPAHHTSNGLPAFVCRWHGFNIFFFTSIDFSETLLRTFKE